MKEHFEVKIKALNSLFNSLELAEISEHSSECAYYTILSFIPFLILSITLIQYTGLNPELLSKLMVDIVPKNMNGVVIKIIEEVYSKSVGTISISIIFTLWSAGNGLYALIKGLNEMYDISAIFGLNHLKLRIRSLVGTILFILFIILSLFIMVFSGIVLDFIELNIKSINAEIIEFVIKIIFLVIVTMVFTFIYTFLPKHKVKLKSQIYGGIFGSISLNMVSFVFSKYLEIFKNFTITYGSLSTLMLSMMWIYYCFYTFFMGAKLNKLVQDRKESGK